jgi:hypothetical protein
LHQTPHFPGIVAKYTELFISPFNSIIRGEQAHFNSIVHRKFGCNEKRHVMEEKLSPLTLTFG